jgi:hypothetical protein
MTPRRRPRAPIAAVEHGIGGQRCEERMPERLRLAPGDRDVVVGHFETRLAEIAVFAELLDDERDAHALDVLAMMAHVATALRWEAATAPRSDMDPSRARKPAAAMGVAVAGERKRP